MNNTRFSILYAFCLLSCWFSVCSFKAQAEVPVYETQHRKRWTDSLRFP